jgi:hypothetical protein
VGLGDVIEQDMIAIPVSEHLRLRWSARRRTSRDTSRSPCIRLALAGVGFERGMGGWVRGHLERGHLIAVLEEYCPPFPGFYLRRTPRTSGPAEQQVSVRSRIQVVAQVGPEFRSRCNRRRRSRDLDRYPARNPHAVIARSVA